MEWPYFKIKALTIRKCMDNGIERVYDPNWLEKNCYIKLPKKIGQNYPPWIELYSEKTQKMLGIETPQKLLYTQLAAGLDSICLEYNGPISEKENEMTEFKSTPELDLFFKRLKVIKDKIKSASENHYDENQRLFLSDIYKEFHELYKTQKKKDEENEKNDCNSNCSCN